MRALLVTWFVLLAVACGSDAVQGHDPGVPVGAGDGDGAGDGQGDGDGDGDAGTDDGDAEAMDSGADTSTEPDAGSPLSRTPRRMLLADEGNAALHYVDLDDPAHDWTYQVFDGDPCCNRLRDMQLIGEGRVMISVPSGYLELDLNDRGQPLRSVTLSGVPGGIEAARRLPNGHTVVAGNGGGIWVYEFDENDELIDDHKRLFSGLDFLRGLRLTEQGTFLFTSDTEAGKRVYEAGWTGDPQLLFDVPADVGARHMTKAVRTGPDEVTVSTGYGASLIRIDTANKLITKLIGGPELARPEGADRDVQSHFYAGFVLRPNGDYVVANWIDHGAGHNGQGYQLLQFDHEGTLIWVLDQTELPAISSLHNVIVLDGLDTSKLYDDRGGLLVPL
jgi:hypothetical protein